MKVDAKQYFSKELLAWYQLVKRDLPWRKNRDPYRVWVSEIMLQQTRVDTVIPYYERFMAKFPTVRHLAEAPEEEVLKSWEGLGYYSRARNLQAGAREVVERYGGIVPDDKEAVASLKGVGPYTSGAIMSIAFNRPEPAVDGNVMRVLSRYFCLEDDIAKPSTRTGIEKLAVSLIPEGEAGDFNQALMELGALVCTPKSPVCLTCPVMEHCAGRLAGKETELPVKTKAKPPREELRAAVIVEGSGAHAGKVLVRRRPDKGLLAQMWEIPHLLVPEHGDDAALAEQLSRTLHEETGLLIRPKLALMDAEHVFSHIHWKMKIYAADLGAGSEDGAGSAESAECTSRLRGGEEMHPLWAAEAAAAYESGFGAPANAAGARTAEGGAETLPEPYSWIGRDDMERLTFPNLFIRVLNHYFDNR
ncbi:A/G-specific adenine glycosylase [Paenibacillus thailandensis]|uniref:Adenine DNA glycosylase n=1 Tax=Paenibacillus thailandensis TaxID=393250 RepID=A0ABW5QZM0_9BACL